MTQKASKEELHKNIIADYRDVLEILNQSTDDFLFLLDLKNDKAWYFGPIDHNYALRLEGQETVTTEEILSIVYPADREMLLKDLGEVASGEKETHNLEYRWMNKDGQKVWINCRGKMIKDSDGEPFVMVGRVSEEAIRHLYNPLTGLFNQIRLLSDLKEVLPKNKQGYLMLVDIDELSAINLSRGRQYGDELLKGLAEILEELCGAGKVYHAERNYFAACLDVATKQEVNDIYEKLRKAMSDRCTVTAGVVPMNSSIFADESSLYDSAKLVLRKAKEKGKNNLDFFSIDEINQKISSVELLEELQESVNNNFEGFYLNYQPQLRAGSYKLYSAEALLRYKSKSGQRVFPDEFIPVLEQSKLIIPVGMWVLETALLQCKEWRKSIPDMRISVNFSTVQFKDKYVVENVLSVLQKTNMPGDALTIEVTESISMYGIENLSTLINHLKSAGIQLAIDDYGTGYANIGYLRQLAIDEIKIDRMFVQGIEENTYNYKLISNTLDFAKMNAIRVCCEGVETTRELTILESRSPDLMQGYLFDKPCEVDYFKEAYIDEDSDKFKNRIDFIHELYNCKENESVIQFDPRDILRETNVGLWVIRIDAETGEGEMHADETMERLLGVDKKYTPKECYDFWYSRVKPECQEYVHTSVNNMLMSKKVMQIAYQWLHPTLGEVEVRCSGKHVNDSERMIVIEGYHRLMVDIDEVKQIL